MESTHESIVNNLSSINLYDIEECRSALSTSALSINGSYTESLTDTLDSSNEIKELKKVRLSQRLKDTKDIKAAKMSRELKELKLLKAIRLVEETKKYEPTTESIGQLTNNYVGDLNVSINDIVQLEPSIFNMGAKSADLKFRLVSENVDLLFPELQGASGIDYDGVSVLNLVAVKQLHKNQQELIRLNKKMSLYIQNLVTMIKTMEEEIYQLKSTINSNSHNTK